MNNSHQQPLACRCQGGFTLVELMVALVIGLAMVAGLLTFTSENKSSYTMQNEIGRLQENARFALDTLSRNIGSAGLSLPPPNGPAGGIVAFDSTLSLENSNPNTTLGLTVEDGTASDQITINIQSVTGATEDCLGQNVAVGTTITNRYYIDDDSGTGLYNLYCEGSGNTGNPQPLVEGVDNMQVLYGEDTDQIDPVTLQYDDTANVYVTAAQVTDWQRVMSVRLSLLMSTIVALPTGETETETFALLNTPTLGPFDNGENRVRRVFTQTIILRSNIQ